MKKIILLLLITIPLTLLAQEDNKSEFGVSLKGFVKTDLMLDSRQTVTAREGHFLLYPQSELLDPNGEDVNEKTNLNMLSIQTRLTSIITAPDAFGAKVSGVVEGAFFGHSNGDINGFRLRHAFVKLAWEKSALIIGQYWNPMFITEVYPGTVSFNTGVPFQPFARNPQVRFIQTVDKIDITLTAAFQRDFSSAGPNGTSSEYLRNAATPILNANIKYVSPMVVAGAGVNYKALTPRTVTTAGFAADEKIGGIAAVGFAKFVHEDFSLKLEGVYGENMTDLMMLGGYAVKSTDPFTAEEEYTNIKTMSAWGDLSYGGDFKLGLFVGYTKNLGADDEINGAYYSRGNNIENVLRVSPRAVYKMGTTQFGAEIEYTAAAYGTPNNKGEVEDTNTANNLRILLSSYLFF